MFIGIKLLGAAAMLIADGSPVGVPAFEPMFIDAEPFTDAIYAPSSPPGFTRVCTTTVEKPMLM